MNREQTIEAILEASATPCPAIVERRLFQHKATGKQVSAAGMPFNANRDDYDLVTVGFVYRDKNGTTYGMRYDSRDSAEAEHQDREDRKRAEFLALLEKMTESEVSEQAAYWLRKKGVESVAIK